MADGGRSAGDVALVIADLGGGGAQRVVTLLAEGWAARGRGVTVITFAGPERDFFALAPGVERIVLGGRGATRSSAGALRANLDRVRRLRRALKSIPAPVVVGFIAHTNVILVLAAIGLGKRVVVSERNDPRRQSFGPIWDALRRWLYPRADVVTANSRAAVEAMAAFVPRAKLAFLPNPLRPPAPARAVRREAMVLAVGRLEPQKGHDVLLEAFAALAPEHRDWRLHLLGEGGERSRLAARIAGLGLDGRVRLEGIVADPFPWYRRAGAFVLASRFEGTPNALMEAMSCGLPPIVSDAATGALDLVEDGRTGLVFPAGDAAALAKTLGRMMADTELRRRIGEAAPGRVAQFALDRVLDVWDETLAGHAA